MTACKDSTAAFGNIKSSGEQDLPARLLGLQQQFKQAYQSDPQIRVRSPGRAEIIGNHTDYNNGYALSAAISRSTLAFFSRRDDRRIRIRSNSFPGTEAIFPVDRPERDSEHSWSNYARGVVKELIAENMPLGGADILVDSNVPSAGGVSTSASFELALAIGLSSLYGSPLDPLRAALLCKRAENGPLVGTPCGLLDQASVALGRSGQLVMLDFQPAGSNPVTVSMIPADLAASGLSFVITVDPEVKRNLGETGYPARRKMCEASLPLLSRLLGRPIESLRKVSVDEFYRAADQLEAAGGKIMRMRVEHIVNENQRVLDAAAALRACDYARFSALLTASGKSALELYGLDEKTPELTFLVEKSREIGETLATRNMGGGFSGIILSLMRKTDVEKFSSQLNSAYRARWNRDLQFIDFQITQGVEVL